MQYFIFKWMDVFKRMKTFYAHIDTYKAERLDAFINKSRLTGFAFMDSNTVENFKCKYLNHLQDGIQTYTQIEEDILFEHKIHPTFLCECLDFGEEISKVEYLCYCATYPTSEVKGLLTGYHCVGADLFNDMMVEETSNKTKDLFS